jgi:hypothetical protein
MDSLRIDNVDSVKRTSRRINCGYRIGWLTNCQELGARLGKNWERIDRDSFCGQYRPPMLMGGLLEPLYEQTRIMVTTWYYIVSKRKSTKDKMVLRQLGNLIANPLQLCHSTLNNVILQVKIDVSHSPSNCISTATTTDPVIQLQRQIR